MKACNPALHGLISPILDSQPFSCPFPFSTQTIITPQEKGISATSLDIISYNVMSLLRRNDLLSKLVHYLLFLGHRQHASTTCKPPSGVSVYSWQDSFAASRAIDTSLTSRPSAISVCCLHTHQSLLACFASEAARGLCLDLGVCLHIGSCMMTHGNICLRIPIPPS